MFLKNYYKLFGMWFTGKSTTAVDCNGAENRAYWQSSYAGSPCFKGENLGYDGDLAQVLTQLTGLSSKDGGNSGVVFGDGTAPVTINDYKMSGNVISGLTASVSQSTGVDDNGVWRTAVYTITNTNSTAVTIAEVGATIVACSSASTQYSTRYSCLVERTVLDSPITIEAGGIGQVTYTIRFNWPT